MNWHWLIVNVDPKYTSSGPQLDAHAYRVGTRKYVEHFSLNINTKYEATAEFNGDSDYLPAW